MLGRRPCASASPRAAGWWNIRNSSIPMASCSAKRQAAPPYRPAYPAISAAGFFRRTECRASRGPRQCQRPRLRVCEAQPHPQRHYGACGAARDPRNARCGAHARVARSGSPAVACLAALGPLPAATLASSSRGVGVPVRHAAQVPAYRLRHVPLFPTNFNPAPGLRVEGYLHDCWWLARALTQMPSLPLLPSLVPSSGH